MININTEEIRVRYKGEGLFVFKRPSAEELNAYTRAKFPTVGRRVKNNMALAHVTFFDKWILRIEGVTVNDAPLTVENKDILPASIKSEIMFTAFDRPEVEQEDEAGDEAGEDLEGNS